MDEFFATLQKGEVVLSKPMVETLNKGLSMGGSDAKNMQIMLTLPDGQVLWDFVRKYRDADEIIEGVMRG